MMSTNKLKNSKNKKQVIITAVNQESAVLTIL